MTDFDRRHNLVLSGRVSEVPHTHGMTLSGTMRVLSGLAMSLIDTSSDPDRNGILADPLAAGTFSGTGANAITVDTSADATGPTVPGTCSSIRASVGGSKPAPARRST